MKGEGSDYSEMLALGSAKPSFPTGYFLLARIFVRIVFVKTDLYL